MVVYSRYLINKFIASISVMFQPSDDTFTSTAIKIDVLTTTLCIFRIK